MAAVDRSGSVARERFVAIVFEGFGPGDDPEGNQYVSVREFDACGDALSFARRTLEGREFTRGEVWLNREVMLWSSDVLETTVWFGPQAVGRYHEQWNEAGDTPSWLLQLEKKL